MTASDTPTTPDTIVLIHGLWVTPLSWERWVDRYSSRGYTVHAPSWPGMEGDIEELRRDPSPVAGLGVTEIVDHYDKFIRSLDRPPIIGPLLRRSGHANPARPRSRRCATPPTCTGRWR